MSFVVVVRVDFFEFGELIHDKFFCLMSAMDGAIVPERSKTFIMI